MQKEVKIILLLSFLFTIMFIFIFVSAQNSTDTMTLEVNVLAEDQEPEIGISVPEYIFLGNISKGKAVSVTTLVNNTGKSKINIKPELTSNDKIFQNLYFRESGGSYQKVGEFNMNITANSKNLYIKLDLSNYTEDIDEDVIGHKANVRFIAVAA